MAKSDWVVVLSQDWSNNQTSQPPSTFRDYPFTIPNYARSIHNRTILETATSLTHQLIKPAICLVGQMFQEGTTYKKAGVMLSGLEPDQSIQGNLFGQASAHSDRFLMAAIDNVNFGIREDTVKYASSGMKRNWKMRQELRSPRASTRWHEMRKVS